MSNTRKTSGGGYIPPVAYAKASLILTPLGPHEQWNRRVNECETIEELNELAKL